LPGRPSPRPAREGIPRAAGRPVVPQHLFPIVGVGASAGGLEAFRQLLAALAVDTGLAYVLVQHLDPRHESILAELLSESTGMDVSEVTGAVRVEPNRIYVIPPAQDIVFVDGLLKLVPRTQTGGTHMPIDSFLQSLADAQGSQSIGVILSGMGSDGTLGLEAIKAEGGITLAQEPRSAKNEDMPRSAIAAGCVDLVLAPQEIARELTRLGRHPYVATAEPHASLSSEAQTRSGLAEIVAILLKTTGADFTAYKTTTLERRIARRMAIRRIETLEEYARHLETDKEEAEALYQDCLISVTSFFRDAEAFDSLRENVLAPLLADRPADRPLRVWVPGCASGEEAYSIAMLLLEAAGPRSDGPPFQIFGTDLSEHALKKARAGLYLENIAQHVSPERLQRFFSLVEGHYQISKAIRETCVFAHHDLTRDPPFSRMDLVSCRNVLIYLKPRLQERVFATFHYSLASPGFLWLGPAETVGETSSLFSVVDDKHRIFAKRAAALTTPLHFALHAADARPPTEMALPSRVASRSAVPREADRLLLVRYGPPSVVVDESLNILEFRGDTDTFLEHAHGQATLNLPQMVRKGLLVGLRQAIEEARKEEIPARRDGLQLRHRGRTLTVSIEVIPIRGHAAAERCLLVLFATDAMATRAEQRAAAAPQAVSAARSSPGEIERLERKLDETTEHLHTVVREHEAALEELQATNEEALSSNEELQSVNEELQTAKEEIQSANEELATLNQELQDRNARLGQTNDDLLNLLGSVNIPVVMVGRDLRLRRFTPAADALFSMTPADVGRALSHVRHRLQAPELEQEIQGVIDSETVSVREVQDLSGRFYSMKIWPYLTRAGKVDGAVVVLVDVDDLKRAADQIQRALDRANAIVATVREPLLILDGELRVEKANRAYYDAFRVGPQDTLGQLLGALGRHQWASPALRTALEEVLATDTAHEGFAVEHDFPHIGRRTMSLNIRCLHHEGGRRGLLVAIEDRTDTQREEEGRTTVLALEHAAREKAEAADHLKDEFVATVSHELRGPLTVISGWTNILGGIKGPVDEATMAKALGAIDRGVKAQSRLVADLLDHARIVSGKVQLARAPLDLFTVAEAALETVRAAAEAKDIEIDLEGDRGASIVLGDADRMQQVLWNLFFNAVKFTPRGGRVRLWTGRVETHVHVTVTDTGQGIGADFLPHVFERFRQEEGSPFHTLSGLGLGLTLVRELVELHGGTVWAESAGEGQGARFTVALPIPAVLAEAQRATPAPSIERSVSAILAPEPAGHPLSGLSVLVVDDDADVRDALVGVLERYGAGVREADGVEAAMAALRQGLPDVLLSDLGMPGQDGYELIRQVRLLPASAGGDVPALAVSAYSREIDLRKARAAGFHVHLAKPVDPTELVMEVARAAGRRVTDFMPPPALEDGETAP
jgi:two-component system, chemotaxis family, CheB/CheR fusion protein